MSRSKTELTARTAARAATGLVAAALAAAALAGCSDMYFDHREGVTLGAGDAIAANEALQTIDPWPARSRNINIAEDGQRMQSAVERYRTNNVTQPVDPMQIQTANQAPPTLQVAPPASAPVPSIGSGSSATTTTVVTAPPQQASQ
ncbi:MAG TPA: hypothetical protein VMU69_31935 [Bradyrhizobium sp.]|nr:hypothetical protein [Bradyrhizobium sp.]